MGPMIPERVLAKIEPELSAAIQRHRHEYVVDPFDPMYGQAFRYYLLFSRYQDLVEELLFRVDQRTWIWNGYYWFLFFTKLYQLKHSFNAGLEQQATQLLQEAGISLDAEKIDRIYERVESRVAAVEHRFRPRSREA